VNSKAAPEVARFKAAERWIVKMLRNAIDRADEFVHGYEVRLRNEAAAENSLKRIDARVGTDAPASIGEGIHAAPPSPAAFPKKKKRRMTAAEFDADMRRRIDARMEFAR